MLRPDYPVLTDRLALRPLVASDAEAVHVYQSRADVCRYIPYEPRTLERVQEVIASPESNRSVIDAPGQAIELAVVRHTDDVLVGNVMLAWRSSEHGTAEIGYVFDPACAGHGYATEAARALLGLAFDDLSVHRVVARIDARNEPSARLLRRLGMREEAYLRENEWFKGGWSDEIDFAMLASEWADLSSQSRSS